MSAVATLPEDHQIGANNPPDLTPYEAVKCHMDDLLTEAHNWADGVAVESQAQADEISRLIGDLYEAGCAADDARVKEKKPHDDEIAEIQSRYNAYIAGLKAKATNPGRVTVAIAALKATLKPFLDKQEADKRGAEDAAKKAAQEAADKAVAAMRAADITDLGARQEAEALVVQAQQAATAATRAANDKARAKGGSRAMGLTRTFTPVMKDRKAALIHYVTTRPDDVAAFLQSLAEGDVRRGKRQIPGFEVVEGTKL